MDLQQQQIDELTRQVASLSAVVQQQAALIEQLQAEQEQLRAENKLLRAKNKALIKRLFGSKSEKIDPNQLMFDLAVLDVMPPEVDDGDDDPTPPRPKRRKRRSSIILPEDIDVVREVIDPPEVQANPDAYDCIGETETVELDVDPMRIFKRVTVRRKYRRRDRSEAPVVAPAPRKLIPCSMASAGLLAYIVEAKYVNHLPLYRIEQDFARNGVTLNRKLMSSWVMQVGDWFRVIYDEMKSEVLSGDYLQVDETPVQYLSPGNGKTKKGFFWVYHAPKRAVLLDWRAGRAATCLNGMLDSFNGHVQSDGYGAYHSYNESRLKNDLTRLVMHGCWAHVRRKFVEAEQTDLTKQILREIQKLYLVERKLREASASAGIRRKARQRVSKPVIDRIFALISEAPPCPPKTGLGKALGYARSQWPRLIRFLDHGQVEIDNNLVENAIRPAALGRKNWLFIGSVDAGQSSAILYSIVRTCEMLGANIREYLTDVMTRLPECSASQARELTPAKWLKAARAEKPQIA